MGDYKHYDENPLELLWDTRKYILPKYLWISWFILGIAVFCLMVLNYIDLSYIDAGNFIDTSISGLSFTLVIVSAAIEIFNDGDLVVLIRIKNNKNIPGEKMLGLLTPYLFTAVLFLLLGIVSLLAPYGTLVVSTTTASILNFIYIMLVLLALFSLFNITYSILNDLYYRVLRDANNQK